MNTDEHESTDKNRQADESDLGPEPDWLLDQPSGADDSAPEESIAVPPQVSDAEMRAPQPDSVEDPAPAFQSDFADVKPRTEPDTVEQPVVEYQPSTDPIEGKAVAVASAPAAPVAPVVRKQRPWLFWAVPLLLVVITAVVAWFGSTQGLNNLQTWSTLRFQHTGLLPVRWAMLMWWIVLPLLAVFLIYSALPAGKELTRIKRTGPLLSVGLIASIVWIIAQHWRWDEVALIAMVVSLIAILATYLLVALNKQISKVMQRVFAVVPLSAALGFTFMLLTISWQNYSTEPFGNRGTSIMFLFLLLVVATLISFFIHDGVVATVFTVWFLGVAIQQWNNDSVISLGAIVTTILTAIVAVLGFIMAAESHRPSLTTQVTNRRGRVNFFRKSENTPSSELP